MQSWADGAISGDDYDEDDNGKGQANHVRNPQEGKSLFVGSMQVTIKVTGAETSGRFSLVEVTVPPYFADSWLHLHQQTTEAIYLTQGMLAVTLGEETMVVRQGSFILVLPKQIHRFWNPAATPATFLSYFTPAGVEGFFEVLSEMQVDGERRLPGALAELWELGMRYDHFPIQSSKGDAPLRGQNDTL
jgi:quercetin dioxygenase-like cupin family protein